MAKDNNIRWLIAAALILIIINMQSAIPKEAVADIDGQPCVVAADCPCWGELEDESEEAFGIGVASCNTCDQEQIDENRSFCQGAVVGQQVCDMTFCFDVEPIGDWTRDHPWQWLKDNPMMTVGILAMTILLVTWPKQ